MFVSLSVKRPGTKMVIFLISYQERNNSRTSTNYSIRKLSFFACVFQQQLIWDASIMTVKIQVMFSLFLIMVLLSFGTLIWNSIQFYISLLGMAFSAHQRVSSSFSYDTRQRHTHCSIKRLKALEYVRLQLKAISLNIFLKSYHFTCMSVQLACMSVQYLHARYPQRQEEGVGYSGT